MSVKAEGLLIKYVEPDGKTNIVLASTETLSYVKKQLKRLGCKIVSVNKGEVKY